MKSPHPAAVTFARGRKVTVGDTKVNRAFRYKADMHSSTCQELPELVLSARDVW